MAPRPRNIDRGVNRQAGRCYKALGLERLLSRFEIFGSLGHIDSNLVRSRRTNAYINETIVPFSSPENGPLDSALLP